MGRIGVSPYRRGQVYWARVPQLEGPSIQRSLDTTDISTADAMCHFLSWARNRRDAYLLTEMGAGRIKVSHAYDAWVTHRLDEFVAGTKQAVSDPDIEPWVARWLADLTRRGRVSVARYERQVRTLMVEGTPFRVSQLTKLAIREWLLTVPSPNRYHAALSSFCTYLVSVDVLAFNPARGVPKAKENKPRDRHLSQEDAKGLLDALSGPARAYHALMAATGMERQAMARLTRKDINLDDLTVFARGGKTAYRERTVTVYWRWTWAWTVFTDWLKAQALLPDAPVFPLPYYAYYKPFKDACTAKGLSGLLPHDWRHTWCVQGLRDGLALHTVSHQMGHGSPQMVLTTYGRYIPTKADFGAAVTVGHTVNGSAQMAGGAK